MELSPLRFLERSVLVYPERLAVVYEDRRYTYRAFGERVNRLASALRVGQTRKAKGAVYQHRGAYLNALGEVIETRLTPESAYLWTLPMFHCNGWSSHGR